MIESGHGTGQVYAVHTSRSQLKLYEYLAEADIGQLKLVLVCLSSESAVK